MSDSSFVEGLRSVVDNAKTPEHRAKLLIVNLTHQLTVALNSDRVAHNLRQLRDELEKHVNDLVFVVIKGDDRGPDAPDDSEQPLVGEDPLRTDPPERDPEDDKYA